MEGHYQMAEKDSDMEDIPIPVFRLAVPNVVH